MSFCIGPLEMVIWVVFDQKMVSINFLCAKTPPYGGSENWPAQGGTKIFFVFKHSFIVVKMTAQNTQTQQKNRERHSLPGGRDICKNVSKSGGLVWLGVFGQFFVVFSGPRQARTFPFFLLSPCVLCGHFDYNKPMFQDKKYFGPRGGWPIFKPPVSGGFCEKIVKRPRLMVKHNLDNHFQAVNAKTHFGTPP